MPYDVAIIGSGVGGMSAACLLAREGLRVIVLEQAPSPGGLMATYRRAGLTFPTGVHYLGALSPGETLWRYFSYLGVLPHLSLHQMQHDGYEEYWFGQDHFRLPQTHVAARAALIAEFPEHVTAIDRYFQDMQTCVSQFPLYTLSGRAASWPTWASGPSHRTYLDGLTNSVRLKAVLTAPSPLYGIHPSECPLYVHFLAIDSYLRGAWQIDETKTPLADAFSESLRSLGGELRCSVQVTAILSNGQAVSGVQLASGEIIEASHVICTTHPRIAQKLCPPGALGEAFCHRVDSLIDTPGVVGLALAWKGDSCPFEGRSIFLYHDYDTERPYHQRPTLDAQVPSAFYCSAGIGNPQSGWPVTVLYLSTAEEWSTWQNSHTFTKRPRPARGIDSESQTLGLGTSPLAASTPRRLARDYRDLKQEIADRLFAHLCDYWPETRTAAHVVDVFTPLTIRDYTLAPNGTAYGISKRLSAGMGALFSPRTHLPGLFMAGQSLVLSGVLGTLISSISACIHLLGNDKLVEKIRLETGSAPEPVSSVVTAREAVKN